MASNDKPDTLTEELRDALVAAYEAGANDVHQHWLENPGEAPRGDTEFGEAADDYAIAAMDPFNSATKGLSFAFFTALEAQPPATTERATPLRRTAPSEVVEANSWYSGPQLEEIERAYREGYRDSRLHGGTGHREDNNWEASRARAEALSPAQDRTAGEVDRDGLYAKHSPSDTCPASRHVLLIAETLRKSDTVRQALAPWDPDHWAGSMESTVRSLWEARAALTERATPANADSAERDAVVKWLRAEARKGQGNGLDYDLLLEQAADALATKEQGR